MNKIAKVWVLGFAFASSLVALLVSATGEVKRQVTLTLTEGSNTCTLSDYMFEEKQASPYDQLTESLGQEIFCRFLKNSANEVSLLMSNLSNSVGIIIPASGFSGQIYSGSKLGSIGDLSDKIISSLGAQQVIYEKTGDTIGEWSGMLTLQGIIPGGTPGGAYTGTIDLILQVN